MVEPTTNKPEAWEGRVRRRPRASVQRLAAGDVTVLYPEAVVGSSDTFAWQDIRVIHLRPSSEGMVAPPSDSHCLVLNLGAPLELRARLCKRHFEGTVRAGEVAIIPAGAPWSCQSRGSHLPNTLLMFLHPLFVRKAAGELNSRMEEALPPQIGFESRHIRHIALSLLGELDEGCVEGRLYADVLAVGLAMQLARRYSTLRDVRIGHGGMAPHRLRKAIDLIDQRLAGEEEGRVALRAIAEEVGMSYFHFSRAFKQSMRMTPTGYITRRRIEYARRLLLETEMPISEIALRAGFSSQSHFTTSFRRIVGATPRAFRARLEP